MARIEQSYTRPPWVVDIDWGGPDVDLGVQIEQLLSNSCTPDKWCAVGICDADGCAEVVALAHPDNARRIVQCVNAHDALVGALKDIIGDGIDVVERAGADGQDAYFACRHCGREWSAMCGDDEVPEYCPSDDCPGHIARAALADAEKVAPVPRGTMSDKKLQALVDERRELEIEIAELHIKKGKAYSLFRADPTSEAQQLCFELREQMYRASARFHTVRKLVAEELQRRHPPGSRTFAKVLREVLKEKGLEYLVKEAQRRWDETKV